MQHINSLIFILIHFLGTYRSCKQVSVPSTGTQALDVMCGNWGASRCTPYRWFEFMGTKSGYVPFQINYLNESSSDVDGFNPMNATTISCGVAPTVSTLLFV